MEKFLLLIREEVERLEKMSKQAAAIAQTCPYVQTGRMAIEVRPILLC